MWESMAYLLWKLQLVLKATWISKVGNEGLKTPISKITLAAPWRRDCSVELSGGCSNGRGSLIYLCRNRCWQADRLHSDSEGRTYKYRD